MCGIAGMMGIVGIVGRPGALALGVLCWGGAADDGVVGCVENSSEAG